MLVLQQGTNPKVFDFKFTSSLCASGIIVVVICGTPSHTGLQPPLQPMGKFSAETLRTFANLFKKVSGF